MADMLLVPYVGGMMPLDDVAAWLLARWQDEPPGGSLHSSTITSGMASIRLNRSLGLVASSGQIDGGVVLVRTRSCLHLVQVCCEYPPSPAAWRPFA